MSSDGDILAFENSVHDNLADANTVLFNEKNWAFITDSTSNSGSFSSGQITFDLSTLASQSQWIDLANAMIEFPVKITTSLTTAATGTPSASTAAVASAIIKNGWHQWIDSCQLIINGQTVQSAQPWENVAAQFRILSSWSQDELVKMGPTCGFALDDCTADAVVSTTNSNTIGIGNAAYGTVAANIKGLDVVNNQAILFNKGVQTRSQFTNYNIAPSSDNLQTKILGAAGMKAAGRSNVASLSGGSNTPGTPLHAAYYMATCKLGDLCDIKDIPMTKNLKGFIYLSFNSSSVALTGGAFNTIGAVQITPLTGHTTPFLINNSASGITFGDGSTISPVITVVGTVDATATTGLTTGGPLLTNARLLCPYYYANPKADAALSQSNKFFTTLEKIVSPFTVAANTPANITITTGVPNPRRLILLPLWQNLGGVSNLSNPEQSPFDSVPGSSGPFADIQQLQVYVGNKPLYQYPIQYSFEQWVEEQAQLGLNGNAISESTSGLLSQQLWEQNHRFYTVDLSRRMDSEDGSSKSVQVSFTNPSANFSMKVIAIVQYEKRWMMNTSQCQLSSV